MIGLLMLAREIVRGVHAAPPRFGTRVPSSTPSSKQFVDQEPMIFFCRARQVRDGECAPPNGVVSGRRIAGEK
jgi:hypothetical protein